MPNIVMQDWLRELSWKKQTVALACIRAPDVHCSQELRRVFRYLRAMVLRNADPSSQFMETRLPNYSVVHRDFERLPLHCAHHVLQAIMVIAYDHPNDLVAKEAMLFYQAAVLNLHLRPEEPHEYHDRLEDAK